MWGEVPTRGGDGVRVLWSGRLGEVVQISSRQSEDGDRCRVGLGMG